MNNKIVVPKTNIKYNINNAPINLKSKKDDYETIRNKVNNNETDINKIDMEKHNIKNVINKNIMNFQIA